MPTIEQWVREHFKVGSVHGSEAACFCPLHSDKGKPSLYINMDKAAWKCHAGCGQGKLTTLAKRLKLSAPEAGTPAPQEKIKDVTLYIPEAEVAAATKALWSKAGKGAVAFLRDSRGISANTAKKFDLGLRGPHITIPVRDYTGGVVNIRLYDWAKVTGNKYQSWGEGHGGARLWPAGIVEKHESLVIFEGELDCILAHSMGIDNAITASGGASTWTPAFTRALAGKHLMVIYDIDDAGRHGASTLERVLAVIAASINRVDLPISEPKNGDFTDFCRSLGFERKRVLEFLGSRRAQRDAPAVRRVHFAGLEREDPGALARLNLRAVVSGKDLTPFNVPASAVIRCVPSAKSTACQLCPLLAGGGSTTVTIPVTSKAVLRSVMAPDNVVEKSIKEHCQMPDRCPGNQITITKTTPLWDLRLSSDVDSGDEEGAEGSRRAFSMENLQTNQPYDLELVSCSDPKTQYSLLHILKATTSLTSLDSWVKDGKELLLKLWEA